MLDRIAIVGYSGHAYVVAETAISAGMALTFYCEKTPIKANPFQLKYLGFENDHDFNGWGKKINYILGIGDNKLRHRIGRGIIERNEHLLNVVDSTALLSKSLEIGAGNFIAKRVCINALVSIKDFCILNTGCIVEHECSLASGVHIGPGAVLLGNVKVGENSFIGANSVVKQGVQIGQNVTVGAGSVIIKDISNNQTVVGNPGRVL